MKIYLLLSIMLMSETTVAMQNQNQKTTFVYLTQQNQAAHPTGYLPGEQLPEHRDLEMQVSRYRKEELHRLGYEAALQDIKPKLKKFCACISCIATLLLTISICSLTITRLSMSSSMNSNTTRNGTFS